MGAASGWATRDLISIFRVSSGLTTQPCAQPARVAGKPAFASSSTCVRARHPKSGRAGRQLLSNRVHCGTRKRLTGSHPARSASSQSRNHSRRGYHQRT